MTDLRVEWCPECGGDGEIETYGPTGVLRCRACDGQGYIQIEVQPIELADLKAIWGALEAAERSGTEVIGIPHGPRPSPVTKATERN